MSVTVDRARRIRAREPYTTARDAILRARYEITAPTREDGDVWESEGFTLRVRVTPDDMPYDGDVPRFISSRNISADERREVISVRGYMPADDDYAETPDYPRTERIRNYSSRGASHDVARELAERDMHREVSAYFHGAYYTYVVTVEAMRADVVLGGASLFGVTSADDWGDSARYLYEVSEELATEAIESARETVSRICSGSVHNG